MIEKLDGLRIVGGMASPGGGALFDRGAVVLEDVDAPGTLFRVRRHVAPDQVEVEPMTADDWAGLVASEQAMRVAPVPARAGAALWLLRSGIAQHERMLVNLIDQNALIASPVHEGSEWVLLVDERAAGAWREVWGVRAFDAAVMAAQGGQLDDALGHAELAFALASGLRAERVALLCTLYERAGRVTRGMLYRDTARRSRGEAFVEEVDRQRRQIEGFIDRAAVSRVASSGLPSGPAMRAARAKGIKGGLELLNPKKKVA